MGTHVTNLGPSARELLKDGRLLLRAVERDDVVDGRGARDWRSRRRGRVRVMMAVMVVVV